MEDKKQFSKLTSINTNKTSGGYKGNKVNTSGQTGTSPKKFKSVPKVVKPTEVYGFTAIEGRLGVFTTPVYISRTENFLMVEATSTDVCRFVARTTGLAPMVTFKFLKPLKDEKSDFTAQGLVSIKEKNLIMQYDKNTDTLSVYKIHNINPVKRLAEVHLYVECVAGTWSKEPFESIATFYDVAKKKMEDSLFTFFEENTKMKKPAANATV